MSADLMHAVATLLAAAAAAGVAWYFAAGVKIKAGWQNGTSPLARWLDARRRAAFNAQLPEALATMSNALRAGFSISQAFDSVVEQGEAPMSEEFAILRQQLQVGMSFEDALESLSQRVGSDDLTLVTTSILQGRLQGAIVSLMPVLLGGAMLAIKPKMMIPFLCSATGAVSVLVMFALIAIGWAMIRRIIRIDV